IQRSTNDGNFISIGAVAASGNKMYDFKDNSVPNGLVLYRLIALTTDNNELVIGNAKFNFNQDVNLTIHPNPFDQQIYITSEEDIESISIYDITGKLVFMRNGHSNQNLSIDTEQLNAGSYSIKVKTTNSETVHNIVKK